MAIAAVNATMQAVAPAETGQILAFGPGDAQNIVYRGYGTATLDGSTTSFALNFIDGTKTLPFTPNGIIGSVSGGDQQATAYINVTFGVPSNTGVTVYLSGAGTNTKTLKVAFLLLK